MKKEKKIEHCRIIPKSNGKISETNANDTHSISHLYMTVHFPGLAQMVQ